MAQKLVIGNWKMNGDRELVSSLISSLKARLDVAAQVVVCPPVVYLDQARQLLEESDIALGAQNVNPAESGAYTGELAVNMLREFGCTYVLVGHSERRSLYGESNEFVAEKCQALLAGGLTPVVCVGETLSDRENGKTNQVVLEQLDAVLDVVGADAMINAVVAYEPVWAIGTGKTATPEQAQEVHALIRARLAEIGGRDLASHISLLYGGSVKAENAQQLFAMNDIDGGLIGGASLDSEQFISICSAAG